MVQSTDPILHSASPHLIARHPGMRLNAAGDPVPQKWITAIILGFCLPGMLVMLPLPSVVLTPSALASFVPLANYAAIGVAALVFWVSAGMLRSWANREQKSSTVFGFLILTLIFTPTAYGLSKATLLRVLPLTSVYLTHAPKTFQRTYKYITYNSPCRRKCAVRSILGIAGASYTLKLPDYPSFVAPITLYEKPEGFPIQHSHGSWPGELPSLNIVGDGNWLAIRVKSLSPVEQVEAREAINSTG